MEWKKRGESLDKLEATAKENGIEVRKRHSVYDHIAYSNTPLPTETILSEIAMSRRDIFKSPWAKSWDISVSRPRPTINSFNKWSSTTHLKFFMHFPVSLSFVNSQHIRTSFLSFLSVSLKITQSHTNQCIISKYLNSICSTTISNLTRCPSLIVVIVPFPFIFNVLFTDHWSTANLNFHKR